MRNVNKKKNAAARAKVRVSMCVYMLFVASE